MGSSLKPQARSGARTAAYWLSRRSASSCRSEGRRVEAPLAPLQEHPARQGLARPHHAARHVAQAAQHQRPVDLPEDERQVAERHALPAPVAGRGRHHHVSAGERLVWHAADQLPADAVPEGHERQRREAPGEPAERGRHIEPAPVAHARVLRRERRARRGADAAVVVQQGVIAALRAAGGELQIELAPKARGAVDHESAARAQRFEEQPRELTPVTRHHGDRLRRRHGQRGRRRQRGACRRRAHWACSAISSHSASIAACRALLLRHTAPMCRTGVGRVKGRSTTPRALR